MNGMKVGLSVTYEDGTTVEVSAGQREMADWEGQPFGCATTDAMDRKPMMFLRYLAWAALKRRGEKRSYAVWSDAVETVADAEPDEAPNTDPTRKGRRAGR